MKSRSILLNLSLLAFSFAASLLLSELAARWILNPADYLSVEMQHDPVLGAVPTPNTIAGGFDAWAFRNSEVPQSADIVAIGDSHTYGNTAAMQDSWPHVLAKVSGKRVYNMGMGGYGPNQYLHLLKTRGLSLKPSTVLIGLYMGDDFENAFLVTYGLEHWAGMRELSVDEAANFDIWKTPQAPSWHKNIRIWLSRNSVVYQVVVHGPLLGRLKGEAQINNVPTNSDAVVSLDLPDENILEAFRPQSMQRLLDQQDTSIREGMRITFDLLSQMNDLCRDNGAELAVVVIPTKEMVFAEHLQGRPDLHLSGVLDDLLANERLARQETFSVLSELGIRYADTLPALRKAIGNELYAKSASDMHPGRNGYEVIATATHALLK